MKTLLVLNAIAICAVVALPGKVSGLCQAGSQHELSLECK